MPNNFNLIAVPKCPDIFVSVLDDTWANVTRRERPFGATTERRRTLCQMAIMPNNSKQNSWAQMPQHGCPSVGWHMSKRHKESILLGVKPFSIMAIRHNVIKKSDWLCLHVVMPNGIMPNSRRGTWVIRHKPQQSKGNLCNLAYRTFGITRRVYFGYAEWPYPRFHE